MTTERIEEIQKQTAYPDSISVQKALLQVWNECEQDKIKVGLSSETCDARITKYVNTLDTPRGQDQFTHDTAFVKGAIWMREFISELLGENQIKQTT